MSAKPIIHGAGAGVMATVAMSLMMLVAQKTSRVGRLPPRKITEAGLAAAGAERTSEDTIKALSTVAHFGFGGAAGGLYGLAAEKTRLEGAMPGMVFGMLVWLVSYQGWIPGLGILPRPEHDRKARALTMFVAHMVYGGCLGWVTKVMKRPKAPGSARQDWKAERPRLPHHA